MINPVNKSADMNRSVQTDQTKSAKTKTETSTSQPVQGSEDIKLDQALTDIKKLRQIIDNTSNINHTRIEYLKSLVDSGEYQINSQTIADKLNEE